jgi:hypothetical protein
MSKDPALPKGRGCGRPVYGAALPRGRPVQTKVSRTDPDAGYMVREGKPKGFFYLDHRTVDGKLGIITHSYVTPASVHDSIPYLARLDRQRERFGLAVAAVGLDAGYVTAAIAKGLEDRGVQGVTGYRRPTPPKPGGLRKSSFVYDRERDVYRCPQGQQLAYATTDRGGYRHYQSDPGGLFFLPAQDLLHHKRQSPARHHPAHLARRARARRRPPADRVGQADLRPPKGNGGTLLRRRQAAVGHRYARFRGLVCQCLLAAAAQNMKKIALVLTRQAHPARA